MTRLFSILSFTFITGKIVLTQNLNSSLTFTNIVNLTNGFQYSVLLNGVSVKGAVSNSVNATVTPARKSTSKVFYLLLTTVLT